MCARDPRLERNRDSLALPSSIRLPVSFWLNWVTFPFNLCRKNATRSVREGLFGSGMFLWDVHTGLGLVSEDREPPFWASGGVLSRFVLENVQHLSRVLLQAQLSSQTGPL